MPRTTVSALAALMAVTGCASPAPKTADRQAARPATSRHSDPAATITTVPEPATYAMIQLERPDLAPVAVLLFVRGDRIGFRKDAGGVSVAVAGRQTIVLPDGIFGWVVVEKPANGVAQQNEKISEVLTDTIKAVGTCVYFAGVGCLAVMYFFARQ